MLVVAGAPGLTGAGCLCARAALRAGAGLVVAAAPAEVQPIMAAQLLEVMCAPVPGEGGHLGPESVEPVLAQARRAGAVAIGPGIGREEATTAAVHRLLAALELPVVLDADGLWHLGDDLGRIAGRAAPTVLTPHAGEAGRLLGRARAEVEAGRLDAARELAARSGAVAVLKGAGDDRGRARRPPGGERHRHAGARHRRHGRRPDRGDRRVPVEGHGAVRRRRRRRRGRTAWPASWPTAATGPWPAT